MSKISKFLQKGGVSQEPRKKSALSTFFEEVDEKDQTTQEKVEDTSNDKKKTVGKKVRDKVKQVVTKKRGAKNVNEDNDEAKELTPEKEAIEYMWNEYPSEMDVLEKIYIALRTHLFWGRKEDKEENEGAKNLLDYLGLEEKNLTQIFMAIFGKNKNADQEFEVRNALTEDTVKNMGDFILRKMLGFPKGSGLVVMKEEINKLKNNLILPELMDMSIPMRDMIGDIYEEILEEEGAGKKLTLHEQIEIARKHGALKKQPTNPFDEEKVTQTIKKWHNDGRDLDEEEAQTESVPQPTQPSQPQATTAPAPQPTAPPKPQPKATEKNEQIKLDEAIQRLQGLIEKFRQSNNDPIKLATQVNETEVAQGNLLGFTFFRQKGGSDTPDIKQIIAEHFELEDEKEIDAKVIEIDTEFEEKNIY